MQSIQIKSPKFTLHIIIIEESKDIQIWYWHFS